MPSLSTVGKTPHPWGGLAPQTSPRPKSGMLAPRALLVTAQHLKGGPMSRLLKSSLAGRHILSFAETVEVEVPQAALGNLAHGTGDSGHSPVAEEDVGTPTPAPGLLQVTERRRKYRGPVLSKCPRCGGCRALKALVLCLVCTVCKMGDPRRHSVGGLGRLYPERWFFPGPGGGLLGGCADDKPPASRASEQRLLLGGAL